ncbi:MAG: hypothetical protein VX785_12130 [Actinomycetota bacterium]|nr:hypothetical protein [Acidimicrobiales bacterium]MEC8922266.1 hypothetical protein [Actinomycetota bacterium]MEC9316515.1 hypothetical protein [Actinomycetota bacterium]MED5553431.1 hypothetical protein [Actinomycetota bacterium]MEE3186946.1 hypothetical protein [Actinomycetota bacterium]
MRALLYNAWLCLLIMSLGACSGDNASAVLGGAMVSVTTRDVVVSTVKQQESLPDEESASLGIVRTGVPVLLTVLERPTLNGATFDPASLAGRDVLLWFWAPW